ncbi:hypothetical protein KCU99_g8234, partial [Aureobasidium melanogenum]
MQIDLDSFTVQVDDAVHRYIKVKTAWMELSRFPVDDQARICKLLLTKSESTFLWVAFVCQEVRNLPASEVIRVVSAMPEGLHRLYEKNMQLLDEACHDSNEFAIDYRKLVWTLYNLSGSPHLLELAVLAGLSTEKASDESYLIRVIRECNTFIVLTDSDAVRLVHKSAEDYLRKLQSKKSPLTKSPTPVALARRCIQILQRSLHRNLTDLRELDSEAQAASLELQTRFSSMAGYSCVHWIEHIIKAGVPFPDTVDNFLRQYLCRWLEAISILGRYRLGLNQLVQLDFALKAISKDQDITLLSALPFTGNVTRAELHEFVRNARDFATTSSNVIERWPLQVYSSALIFFASESDLDEVLVAERPGWIVRCLRSEHRAWHPKPSVTLEHGHTDTPDIALSRGGEHLVTSSLDCIRVWQLGVPGHFIELPRTISQANQDYDDELRLVIEGDEVRATWPDNRVRDRFITCWATWNIHTGKLVGEGNSAIIKYNSQELDVSDPSIALEDAAVLWFPTFDNAPKFSFSSDRKLFATVDERAEAIRIWSTSNGEALSAVDIESSVDIRVWKIASLRFCCGDRLIVYQAYNFEITILVVCDIKTSKVMAKINDLDPKHRSAWPWVVDENGDYIAYDTGYSVDILEIATNRVVQSITAQHSSCFDGLALSTEPLSVAAVTDDGTIRIWDVDFENRLHFERESAGADDDSIEYLERERELGASKRYGPVRTNCWLPSSDNTKLIFFYALGSDEPPKHQDLGSPLAYAFSPDNRMFTICLSQDSLAPDLVIDGYLGPNMHRNRDTAIRWHFDTCLTTEPRFFGRFFGLRLAILNFAETSSHESPS